MRGDLLIGIVVTTILATIINEAAGNDAGFTAGRDAGPATSTRRPTWRCSATSTSTRSPSSPSSRRSSGRSRSSSPTSSTRWARSSASASRPGYLDKDGRMQDIRKPLLVDSLAAVAGGAASSSSATTYIESALGRRRRRPDGLGRRRVRGALLPVHVLRPDHRDGAAAGNGAGTDPRRLHDDVGADRGRGDGRGKQDGRKLAGIDFTDLGDRAGERR